MLAPPRSHSIAGSDTRQLRLMVRWLYIVASLIVMMVIVGGITRLTESGLSITEWRPITGVVFPISQADWEHAFALYRTTTEAQTVNASMTLDEFKFIFFWEWAHRLLGRLIGVVYALPLLWFAVRRAIPRGYGVRLSALLALGGLQGAVGWWMVSSGLSGRVDVSHLRLAVHLSLALILLGGIVWTARDLTQKARDEAARPALLTRVAAITLMILAVQILWGAFVAGLRAGYAFPTWPLMGDELFPSGTPMLPNALANLVHNPVVVQFAHRWWAVVAFGAMIWLGVRAVRAGGRAEGRALHALVTLQSLLGIATLMSGVALWIAAAHQAAAALLVVAATLSAHRIGRR